VPRHWFYRFKDEVVTGAEGEKLKLKWPLNENMVVGFIDFLTKKQTKWHHSNKMKHLAPSTIGHYFSAFRDLYNLHSQPVPDFIDKFFSNTYIILIRCTFLEICIMGMIYLMLIVSLCIAAFFLLFFLWATKNGQFDDDYTPSVRMLFEDEPKLKDE
jgi:cbb3-type cytochrome oxidase maturation protein